MDKKGEKIRVGIIYSAESILFLLAATLLGMGFREIGFTETNVVLLYILAVFITASLTRGYLWGILSSVAATLTFNYFFTKPYHSLQFYDAGYMVTFAVMTVVALVTSALTSREKENAKKALERERQTQALYLLTSHLTEAKELSDAAETAVSVISDLRNGGTGKNISSENRRRKACKKKAGKRRRSEEKAGKPPGSFLCGRGIL